MLRKITPTTFIFVFSFKNAAYLNYIALIKMIQRN